MSAAALLSGEPRRVWADEKKLTQPKATADSCILLWMGGGMAAPDTFDPKKYVPFAPGVKVADIESTFPAIDTALPGVKICEGLENVARVLDRGTLLRSHVQADLGSILHSRHQYHWHTGYVPPQTVAAPHIGAWMAKVLGPRNPVIPAFINIGQRLEGFGEVEEVKAFTTAGFFGNEFGPMNLPFPEQAAESVRPGRQRGGIAQGDSGRVELPRLPAELGAVAARGQTGDAEGAGQAAHDIERAHADRPGRAEKNHSLQDLASRGAGGILPSSAKGVIIRDNRGERHPGETPCAPRSCCRCSGSRSSPTGS